MLIAGVVVPLATLKGALAVTLLTLAPEVEEMTKLPPTPLMEIPDPAAILITPVFDTVTLPTPLTGLILMPAAPITLETAPPPPPPEELITPVILLMLSPEPTINGPETPLI
jgi:hypothetical protein